MFRKLCAMLLAVALETACAMNPRTYSFAELPKHVKPGDAIELIAEPTIEQAANQMSFSTSWDQLGHQVRPGDAVIVVLATGGEIEGKLGAFSSSSLTLLVGRSQRELQQGEIFLISQSGRDSLLDGALRGLGLGAIVGVLAPFAFVAPPFLPKTGNCVQPCRVGSDQILATSVAFFGGVGATIGLVVDAVTNRDRRVIYAAPAAPLTKIVVSPILSHDRKGVLLSLRFSQ